MAKDAVAVNNCSIRLACQIFQISCSCYQYQNKRPVDNPFLAQLLLQLTSTYRGWRFGLYFLYQRNVKGYRWNHKQVYRIYRELELNLQIKSKKRRQRERSKKLVVSDKINEC